MPATVFPFILSPLSSVSQDKELPGFPERSPVRFPLRPRSYFSRCREGQAFPEIRASLGGQESHRDKPSSAASFNCTKNIRPVADVFDRHSTGYPDPLSPSQSV